MEIVQFSACEIKRCIIEASVLTVKPFVAGYSAGCYIEHEEKADLEALAEADAEEDMGDWSK